MYFFNLIEQHSKILLHTLQVLYMCTLCDSTNINGIYRSDGSGVGPMMIRCYSPGHLVLQMQPHVISFLGVTSRIGFMFLLFPASIPVLKVRIRTAIETITADRLQTVWNKLIYHVDVYRITKGAHIEHL